MSTELHLQLLSSNFHRKSKDDDKVSDKHSATETGHTVQKETRSFISLLLRPLHISALDSRGAARPRGGALDVQSSPRRRAALIRSDIETRGKTLLIGNKKTCRATVTAERSASFSLVVSCVESSRGRN